MFFLGFGLRNHYAVLKDRQFLNLLIKLQLKAFKAQRKVAGFKKPFDNFERPFRLLKTPLKKHCGSVLTDRL